MKFTTDEIQEIKEHGLSQDQVESQIEKFKNGVPNVELTAPATIGDGILKLTEDEEMNFLDSYEKKRNQIDILKFTPASGAASRMFKKVYQFLEEYDFEKESIDEFLERTNDGDMKSFFNKWQAFPFYDKVQDEVKKRYNEDKLKDENKAKYLFVKTMMNEDGFNYGNYPKGLLPFHKYESSQVTAFEEHLHEAAAYAAKNGHAQLHFTVSPEHEERFKNEFEEVHASVSNATGVNFKVDYSFQKPETDTVAVNLQNELYRRPDGKLLFRPGGHGALIANLNDVDADVIFIKNIDNVLVQDQIITLAKNKKILAGVLLNLQEKVFKYSRLLNEDTVTESDVKDLEDFLQNDFSTRLDDDYKNFSFDEKKEYLYSLLDRPIRVCGMVKNEGEPGGGPFWVTNPDGKTDLQIIESAQVDQENPEQQKIFSQSTHFNPVDIVCGVRNYKGEKYDLIKYVNPDLAFIASKTSDGDQIKALELPGLWNGAMAKWNTIFVEVPLETFNPVKTVNDLLKPAHQVA